MLCKGLNLSEDLSAIVGGGGGFSQDHQGTSLYHLAQGDSQQSSMIGPNSLSVANAFVLAIGPTHCKDKEKRGWWERETDLEHVCILEGSPPSCLDPHLGLLALAIVWAVVQVLGLDEVQALPYFGCLKLDKVQVACQMHTVKLNNFDLEELLATHPLTVSVMAQNTSRLSEGCEWNCDGNRQTVDMAV